MRSLRLISAFILPALAFWGCAPELKAPIGNEGEEKAADQLDHGYGLLVGLMGDESKVADILAIKSPSSETAEILVAISEASKKGLEMITANAGAAPAVLVNANGLPLIETDARNRISNSVTLSLLLAGGRNFEVQILLTQDKACGYAAALCESLANADPNRDRASKVGDLGARYAELGKKVQGRLTIVAPPKAKDDVKSKPRPKAEAPKES
ncbi:MAG: hypothetical protein MK085_05605 [Phycisphaerales bacterium]|nr:hypothetical protein [Phycisphaerales bacterium]